MKGIVKINGQEIEIEINEEQFEQLKIKKKTGYERVNAGEKYYFEYPMDNKITCVTDKYINLDDVIYANGNYYSDKTVAENNARADKLFRQLRRFAVENRKDELDWGPLDTKDKFAIAYLHNKSMFGEEPGLFVECALNRQRFGQIYFDNKKICEKAIETFKNELIWYFTEYKDSL